jgi:hypothetical protein
MAEEYAKLPNETKGKIKWDRIDGAICYPRNTDMFDLTERTVRVLPKHFQSMAVGKRHVIFGAYLDVPEKGKGEISFCGMPISSVVQIMDSKILDEIYIPEDFSYGDKIAFRQEDLDSGARVEIDKSIYNSLRIRPVVKVAVWPDNSENKKLLSDVTNDIEKATLGLKPEKHV